MNRYDRVRWKRLHENPNYELSEEGQVRRLFTDKPLSRHWLYGPRSIYEQEHKKERIGGSLCVSLCSGHWSQNSKEFRIWKLMDRHWPDVEYPDHWRSRIRRKR